MGPHLLRQMCSRQVGLQIAVVHVHAGQRGSVSQGAGLLLLLLLQPSLNKNASATYGYGQDLPLVPQQASGVPSTRLACDLMPVPWLTWRRPHTA